MVMVGNQIQQKSVLFIILLGFPSPITHRVMAHFLVYLRLPDLIKFKKIKKVYKFIGVCNIQNEGRGRKKILFARN